MVSSIPQRPKRKNAVLDYIRTDDTGGQIYRLQAKAGPMEKPLDLVVVMMNGAVEHIQRCAPKTVELPEVRLEISA